MRCRSRRSPRLSRASPPPTPAPATGPHARRPAPLPPPLARPAPAEVDADYGVAPRTLANAMTAHPEMVSGEHRSDLALMQAGRGDWGTKIGAEGRQAIGIRSSGLGIAVKVVDGQKRGLYPALVAVLEQLG